MSGGDDNNVDRILREPVSYEIKAMTESPQLTTRLLAEPAGHHTCSHKWCWYHTGAATPQRQDKETAGRRPLPGALSTYRWCIISQIISHMNNAGILFTSDKIYTREN